VRSVCEGKTTRTLLGVKPAVGVDTAGCVNVVVVVVVVVAEVRYESGENDELDWELFVAVPPSSLAFRVGTRRSMCAWQWKK